MLRCVDGLGQCVMQPLTGTASAERNVLSVLQELLWRVTAGRGKGALAVQHSLPK